MKKLLLSMLFIGSSFVLLGESNLQLHYDFRRPIYPREPSLSSGPAVTATYEFLNIDRLGSTFLFVDLDFSSFKALDLAYLEISRSFKFGNFPVEALVEYDGGLLANFSPIPSAYMAGAQYSFGLGDFFLNTYLVYKCNAFERVSHDVQWTLVWNGSFLKNNRLTFNGFVDVWTENRDRLAGRGGKKVVFMAEPQLWYNIVPDRFSVGTEVELTTSFYAGASLYVCPTLALKYSF